MTVWQRQMVALFSAHLAKIDGPHIQSFEEVIRLIAIRINLVKSLTSYEQIAQEMEKNGLDRSLSHSNGFNIICWKGDESEGKSMNELLDIVRGKDVK